MAGNSRLRSPAQSKYVWIGVSLAGLYWVLESSIHYFLIEKGAFTLHLLAPDAHELWKRLLVAGLLVIFGLYAQHGINVRRRTEEALATSEKKYRTLIEEALNPVFVVDHDGRFIEHNEAALQFFECDAEALRRTRCQDVLGPSPTTSETEAPPLGLGQMELDFGRNGTTKTMLLNVVPLSTAGDTPKFVGIGQDITERKQFETNLEMAHAELDQIFRTASSAMRLIDRRSNVLKVNQTFADLSGIPESEAVGEKCYRVFAGEKCHTEDCPLTRVLAGEKEIEYELRKTRNDGTEVICLLTARPFVGPDGQPIGIVESFKDISELVHVQEELRTERDRLRHILFQRFEGVGILRQDHTIEYQNAMLTREIGDCHGRRCYEAFRNRTTPCSPCSMEAAIRTGKLQQCELDVPRGRTREHTYTSFRDANGEEKVLLLLRDVTERKASRSAVIRSEQLAAVGELAAGVAHEINNPINGIINLAEMLASRERPEEDVRSIATKIVSEGDRVANIVESLLSFARRESSVKIPTSVPHILSESLTLVGAQLRKDSIHLEVRVSDGLPPVLCIPQEIQQVLLNVLNNARYALNERYPDSNENKRLLISVTSESNGSTQRGVRISMRDHGTGIPADIVDKVMNPFFSTKPQGRGTGLGLSISHQTLVEHGGRIDIDSREGRYTEVNVHLPGMTEH